MGAGESLQKSIVSLLWDLRAVWPRGRTSATHWTFQHLKMKMNLPQLGLHSIDMISALLTLVNKT